ncbi:hypothetical protein ACFXKW_32165 [Streptomyces sp. NPDC059193]|uniref:hypothetical protein n=1 Tax=Streptomyces sp. NPDC059193 TaxID=3346763 RepID=UPI0036C4A69B
MDDSLEQAEQVNIHEFTSVDAAAASKLHFDIHGPFLERLSPRVLPSEPPADVWCHEGLLDGVLKASQAVHEAAYAVLAKSVGATPVHLELAPGRDTLVGGGFRVKFDELDAQLATVIDVGAGPAHARWLRERGYTHPQLQRCVLEYCTMGDAANVARYIAEGLVIDRVQALRDAEQILAAPRAARTMNALADRLFAEYRLNEQQIAEVFEEYPLPSRPPIWVPGTRLPITAASRPGPLLRAGSH